MVPNSICHVFSLGLSLLFSSLVYAEPADQRYVVAPQCLIKNVQTPYETLAQNSNLLLIKTDKFGIKQFIAEKNRLHSACGGFMDVSEAVREFSPRPLTAEHQAKLFLARYSQPVKFTLADKNAFYSIKYPSQVAQLLPQLNPNRMWTDLQQLTSFPDRYADSDFGVTTANWLKQQVETMAAGRSDVHVFLVETDNYKQPSVVAKFGTSSEPGIVIGAHMDTLSSEDENMPGADDDGTGAVTVLEVARTLLASNTHYKKPIYFVWYSAEEEGLFGSQAVVKEFKKQHIPISQVMHLDMTGLAYKNEMTMWLMDDYVDKNLTSFLENLIKTYVKRAVKHSKCGYACSDHYTWNNTGVPAAIPHEASMENDNPFIHSAEDTMEKLSLEHMADYAKLCVAFAVELAEPKI